MTLKYLPFADRAQAAAASRQAWYNKCLNLYGHYPQLTDTTQFMSGVFYTSLGLTYLMIQGSDADWYDQLLHVPMMLDELPFGTEENETAFDPFVPGEGILNPE